MYAALMLPRKRGNNRDHSFNMFTLQVNDGDNNHVQFPQLEDYNQSEDNLIYFSANWIIVSDL